MKIRYTKSQLNKIDEIIEKLKKSPSFQPQSEEEKEVCAILVDTNWVDCSRSQNGIVYVSKHEKFDALYAGGTFGARYNRERRYYCWSTIGAMAMVVTALVTIIALFKTK